MERFFQRLQVRRDSLKKSEMVNNINWKEDEERIRHGSCHFAIKYFGYTEVTDSKGSDLCNQSLHKLKYNEHGPSLSSAFHRNRLRASSASVGSHSTLQISGDAIRIFSSDQTIIVDIPIGSISFCCPNVHHEHAFAFICKGTPTWKWHCHVMEALFEHGERLNHAFGCAFTICLERKMAEKHRDSVMTAEDAVSTTVTAATGAFHHIPIADRQLDPQANIVADPVPIRHPTAITYTSIDRPRAPREFKERKGSLEGIVMEAHPYKRSHNDQRVIAQLPEDAIELISE